jgi:hypothetical protein
VKNLSDVPLSGRLLVLPANIRRSWNGISGINHSSLLRTFVNRARTVFSISPLATFVAVWAPEAAPADSPATTTSQRAPANENPMLTPILHCSLPRKFYKTCFRNLTTSQIYRFFVLSRPFQRSLIFASKEPPQEWSTWKLLHSYRLWSYSQQSG